MDKDISYGRSRSWRPVSDGPSAGAKIKILVDASPAVRRYFLINRVVRTGHRNGGVGLSTANDRFVYTGRARAIERIQVRVNEQIRVSPIRVIGADGSQLGILPREEAMQKAREAELDLVEVAPNERPPVCRIMDFGKYKYEKKKKSHQHTHHTKTKEIRLRPKTGEHDIDFKIKQAKGFLQHKDKVQVSVIFRGREMAHIEEGQRVMQGVVQELLEIGKIEAPIQQQGRKITVTIAPR